jgi:S-formylglutathione hydrolase
MRAIPILLAASLLAQGAAETFTLHGKSLAGNLIGDSADRTVSVYLPKAYATDKRRRFPVIYLLHGFTDSDEKWFRTPTHWINLPAVLDKAAADFIVVMPNAFNAFQGSMYSTSVTIGDWETFVARELVAAIDAKYRTLPRAASRGLAGHSMGGYGAMRIGMKNPDVFSAVYLLSPCCMTPPAAGAPRASQIEKVKTLEDVAKADFGTKAQLASAAAWSPNPKNPPFYMDLPAQNGEPRPDVRARWAANAPLAMLDQYIPNIKRLRAFGFDAGDKDMGIASACKSLHEALDRYGLPHRYAEYEGNHTNRVAERIEKVAVPFFTEHLQLR